MELIRTDLDGVLIVRPTVRHDERGSVCFMWNADTWGSAGLPRMMAVENHIISHQWVLRGVHRQLTAPQGKLVRALSGCVFDVAVDLRRWSPTFGRWVGHTLDANTGDALWLAPGFGHGFLSLSDGSVVSIQASSPAVPGDEATLAWNEPTVGIQWPLPAGRAPITNSRDEAGAPIHDFL